MRWLQSLAESEFASRRLARDAGHCAPGRPGIATHEPSTCHLSACCSNAQLRAVPLAAWLPGVVEQQIERGTRGPRSYAPGGENHTNECTLADFCTLSGSPREDAAATGASANTHLDSCRVAQRTLQLSIRHCIRAQGGGVRRAFDNTTSARKDGLGAKLRVMISKLG